jgi:predicted 3-demethylubiquinone-9 3-methyltransferase (glyoxalase superfamily)
VREEEPMQKITTFLIFDGRAEEAMNFYTSLFQQSEITSLTRYGPNETGDEGTVRHATYSLNGQVLICIDAGVRHDFSFTPSMSFHVRCDTREEIEALYESLAQGGDLLVPLAPAPLSSLLGWVTDRMGCRGS